MKDLKILWKIVILGGAVLILTRCTTAPTTGPVPDQDWPIPSVIESTCPAPGVYQAVDTAQPVTRRFLETMRYLKVKKVFRYGDYVNETIRNKTLKVSEIELMKEFPEMEFGVVFQHNNNREASFTATRGSADAKRMIELSKIWGQPQGSAIYFGVDWDSYTADHMAIVIKYFEAASPIIKAAGFKPGAYGNGKALSTLIAKGLIDKDHAWRANATGWSGSKTFTGWTMTQFLPTKCGGLSVDFNKIDPNRSQGTWKPQPSQ